MMFFSATYDQAVMEFAAVIVPKPLIIRLKREEESLDNIQQYYVKCANQLEKYNALTNIYGTVGVGQAIIFCHVRIGLRKFFKCFKSMAIFPLEKLKTFSTKSSSSITY